MKKQKINVIDLDKTLVNYDTFRALILREIKKGSFILFYRTFLRFIRLISANFYKMRVQQYLVKKYPSSYFKNYASEIFQQINPEVMEIINHKTDQDMINVLLSASPDEYVQPLCELLNWKGSGSYFDEKNNFHHMYGIQKINWLKEFFPTENYYYHFAISDSKTDWPLLDLFQSRIYFDGN